MKSRREKDAYLAPQVGRKFYISAVYIFGFIGIISFISCIVNGFTDERIAVLLMDMWFMLFTMDIVTIRFKRHGEKSPWHDWVMFSRVNPVDANQKIEPMQENKQAMPEAKKETEQDTIKKAG